MFTWAVTFICIWFSCSWSHKTAQLWSFIFADKRWKKRGCSVENVWVIAGEFENWPGEELVSTWLVWNRKWRAVICSHVYIKMQILLRPRVERKSFDLLPWHVCPCMVGGYQSSRPNDKLSLKNKSCEPCTLGLKRIHSPLQFLGLSKSFQSFGLVFF